MEDDAFIGGLLAEILRGRGFLVDQAANAVDAMELIEKSDPDGLIVDLDLGQGPSGIDVIGALGDRLGEFGVLVLSNYPTASAVVPGATLPKSVGYLLKRKLANPDEVVAALEAVLNDATPADVHRSELIPEELRDLTPAQLELLRLIAMGFSNDMIAKERDVTVRSVESMVNRLFSTLGLSADSRSNARVKAAMLYARTMGIPRSGQA